jgi:hypothetical protein
MNRSLSLSLSILPRKSVLDQLDQQQDQGKIIHQISDSITLVQACQTGGPITCSMRPTMTFLNIYITEHNNKIKYLD